MAKKKETLGKTEASSKKKPACKFKIGDKVQMLDPYHCEGVVEEIGYGDSSKTWYICIVDNNGNEQISKECNFKKL